MDRREYFSCAPGESSGGSVAALMPDCVSGEVTEGTVFGRAGLSVRGRSCFIVDPQVHFEAWGVGRVVQPVGVLEKIPIFCSNQLRATGKTGSTRSHRAIERLLFEQ